MAFYILLQPIWNDMKMFKNIYFNIYKTEEKQDLSQ